jgi:hypothetical protein
MGYKKSENKKMQTRVGAPWEKRSMTHEGMSEKNKKKDVHPKRMRHRE